jgi:hypothetical protein
MLCAKKQQMPILVFGLIQPSLEPTIYITGGEHDNQNTTDAVVRDIRYK